MPRSAAVAVATYARAHVPLYRSLYHGQPSPLRADGLHRLPVLTAERLRAKPLFEQVDNLDDTERGVTPFRLASRTAPAALVTDREDTDAFYDEAKDAFRLLGVRRGACLALLAPPEQRYWAAELSDRLGYAGIRAHLVIDRGRDTTEAALAALRPQLVVACGPAAAASVRPDVTVRDPGHDGADIYLVPEAGIVAVRHSAGEPYRVLPAYVRLEADRGGRLLVTALLRYHQPLIRYLTPDRGRVQRGRLWLTEVAP